MAPSIAIQTESIVAFLLADETESFRSYGGVEPDCPGGPEDSFDPVIIAERLRFIGDAVNKDQDFKNAMFELGQVVKDEAVDAAFEQSVKILCASCKALSAEVPELQLIHASVALGLYLKKNSPALKDKVKNAMTNFLNSHVSAWIAKQGGWDKVPDSK